MPRISKTEQQCFLRLMEFIGASAALADKSPWMWLDGMTTERVYSFYEGNMSMRGVTTRTLNYIGREYLTTEVCREGGKICRKYKALKLS